MNTATVMSISAIVAVAMVAVIVIALILGRRQHRQALGGSYRLGERGDLMVDSLMGTVVVTTGLLAVAGIISSLNQSAVTLLETSERQAEVRNAVHAAALGEDTPIPTWRDDQPADERILRGMTGAEPDQDIPAVPTVDTPGVEVAWINAAYPDRDRDQTCEPTNLDDGCLVESLPVISDNGGFAVREIPTTVSDRDAMIDTPGGTSTIQWIAEVTGACEGTVFAAHAVGQPQQSAEPVATIETSGNNYAYGSLTLRSTGGSAYQGSARIQLSMTPAAACPNARFTDVVAYEGASP
ncbi:hypothetical protein [Nesterenkonia rhizosphaerae]|uniref:Uncharacterized protein n=1 Tax=Nesterenkonia rhizosphaerae TaxID=1348272 RepID=A0ABP9G1C3_9MICC